MHIIFIDTVQWKVLKKTLLQKKDIKIRLRVAKLSFVPKQQKRYEFTLILYCVFILLIQKYGI